ncbi:Hypothetical predicted protein [Paramuricea clavata]|uniref:Uncharacterized protein n=1 Tax=Paramuricea clavata TaxID=317549 RepID=A0A7D9K3P4_PARCT|nr:Hypothetical predicted protein [Paramuricea clavata]
MGKTGQKCSHCHQRNHTVRSCKENKCESSLLCGLLSKHPDEKKQFDEKKRAVAARETSLKKLQQELTSRQNSFYRVNNSVNMNIEDMLIQEYPEDYVIDGTRNWLKLQKDVALVKKNIRTSSDITRSKIRSILSTNAGLSLPPRMDSEFDNKPQKTAMQCKLESYGVNFPIRSMSKTKKCESVDMAFSTYLQPNSEDEEIEQLRMATKLSLVTKEPSMLDIAVDDVMNTGETQGEAYDHGMSVEKTNKDSNEEAANILLGMSRVRGNMENNNLV